jgi:hypothetical protein
MKIPRLPAGRRGIILIGRRGVKLEGSAYGCDPGSLVHRGGGARIFVPDPLENLFAVHGNRFGRIYADSHLIAFDPEHGHGYFLTDYHGFSNPSRKYQHWGNAPCY